MGNILFYKYVAYNVFSFSKETEYYMIPVFPEFKRLELSDKAAIEHHTSQFLPYSDFNFISMWSWNTKEEMLISELNGNLVVLFNDYITGEPFCSFLGIHQLHQTIEILLRFSIEKKMKPKLNLIPHDIVRELGGHSFIINEDNDNFDYIYDVGHISRYQGGQFLQKRNKVNVFLKKVSNPQIQIIDLQDPVVQHKILALDEYWLQNKIKKDSTFKIENELLATRRFFQAHFPESLGIGLYQDATLIGYAIFSVIPKHQYATSHFCKADTAFTGIYDYLIQESAKILAQKECLYLNYEQDLGLPGLRASKKSFMTKFLRKFVISISE
jgi:hypothetical protein